MKLVNNMKKLLIILFVLLACFAVSDKAQAATYIQSVRNGGNNTANTTVTCTLNSVVANNFLVFGGASQNSSGAITVQDSNGTPSSTDLPASTKMAVFHEYTAASGTHTFTFTRTITGYDFYCFAAEFSGMGTALDTSNIGDGAIPSMTSPTITTTNASDLLIGYAVGDQGSSPVPTAGAGWTLLKSSNYGGADDASEYRIVSSTGNYTATYTFPGSAGGPSGILAYQQSTDTTAPSVPTNLSATAISSSQINLSWSASTDDVGVVGYKIYRNGTQITTTTNTNYSDTGLTPSTIYSYTVSAYDAAGNNSAQSTAVSATTQGQGTTSVISQYGITWYFDRAYPYGQFANGDYWVVGPVTITRITPDFNGAHNGWEVNPNPSPKQGFDAGGYNWDASRIPSLPYLASPGQSIVKGLSYIQDPADTSLCYFAAYTTCLETAAVLTVVDATPPDQGSTVFRPPYVGTQKPYYSISDLRTDLLPSLSPVTSTPSLDDPEFQAMKRVQLDHFEGVADRTARPKLNLPDYGGSIGRVNGDAALRLMLNDSIQTKMPLLIAYVQGGIDRYYMAVNGQTWPGGGGWETGEKLPIAFAAVLLNDQSMKNFVGSGVRIADEDGATSITSNQGVNLWGDPLANTSFIESSYWDWVLHDPGYNDDGGDFYKFIDGGGNTVRIKSDYQVGIVSPVMKSSALAAILMPTVKEAWNNQKFFNYVDRWVNIGIWTQPDPCAPVVGVCQGGTNPGAKCTTQTEILTQSSVEGHTIYTITGNAACTGGGTCNYTDATTYQNNFGVTYGPAGSSSCILDPNLTPGSATGRRPSPGGRRAP